MKKRFSIFFLSVVALFPFSHTIDEINKGEESEHITYKKPERILYAPEGKESGVVIDVRKANISGYDTGTLYISVSDSISISA